MSELHRAARALSKALDATLTAVEAYAKLARETGNAAEGGATAVGLDSVQLRRKIQSFIIAKLSPRPVAGVSTPFLKFDGAPEARKYIASHPLPGL